MAEAPATRIVRLIVCDGDGTLVGTTREFAAPSPDWRDVESLVPAALAELGLCVTVLRLVGVDRGDDGAPDRTTYLVEAAAVAGALAAATAADERLLAAERFRMPWAEPGGPAAHLAWAVESLGDRGIRLAAEPVHVRSWNLSGIWRLPTTSGTVWLKAVPPFFAHEGAVVERFSGLAVPKLLARADGMCLLADVDGDDLYSPTDEQALAMVDSLIAIQRGPGADVDALAALGLPDWRLPSLAAPSSHTLGVRADDLDADERRAIGELIAGLDARRDALVACGIPDALVHGDFHPGNIRGSGLDLTILDWGDSGIGHPLLDEPAFTQWMPAAQRTAVEAHWAARWRQEVPGSDPTRAATLIAPVAALRMAVIYRSFLDHIEPDERVYHEDDDILWLRRTVERLRVS